MDIIARRQFAPLYIWLKHYFSGGVSSASSCKKEIYDSVGRASDGHIPVDLRNSLPDGSMRFPLQNELRRIMKSM